MSTVERKLAAELVFENRQITKTARQGYVDGLDALFRTADVKAEVFKRGFILRFDFYPEPFVYLGDVDNSAYVSKTFAEWHKEEFDHLPAFALANLFPADVWYAMLFEVKNNG